MKKKLNIRKIANASLAFLLSASYVVHAMEDNAFLPPHQVKPSTNTRLRNQIRAEVNRVLRNFEDNMNAYYRRTGNPKRLLSFALKIEEERQAREREAALKVAAKKFGELADAAAKEAALDEMELKSSFLREGDFDGHLKTAFYLKCLLDRNPTHREIWDLANLNKKGFAVHCPTKAQFSVLNRKYTINVDGFDALVQQYNAVKVRIRQELPSNEEPIEDQIFEVMRQQDSLEIGLDMNQTNERIRQQKLGNVDPSRDEIEEGLRLQAIGVESPNTDQIAVGLFLEKKDTPDEVKELTDLYIDARTHLENKLRYRVPSPRDIVTVIKLEKALGSKGCDLHLMLEDNLPKELTLKHAPAIVKLNNGQYNLIVNEYGYAKRIELPEGMGSASFADLFQDHTDKGKVFIGWDDPVMKNITSKGGHARDRHQLTRNEFVIGASYLENGKDFILAAVYLYEQLKIRGEHNLVPATAYLHEQLKIAEGGRYLIEVMKELLGSKNEPTGDDLKESLISKIFNENLTKEQHNEITRQSLDVLALFQDKACNPEEFRRRINQGVALGTSSTEDQIKIGIDLGGDATLEQVGAKMEIIRRFEEVEKDGLVRGTKVEKSGYIRLANRLKKDQIDAWLHLRDILGKSINTFNNFNDLNAHISAVIRFREAGEEPDLDQVKEMTRLGEQATVDHVKESLVVQASIQSAFGELKLFSVGQIDAWLYLRDTLKKDIGNFRNFDDLDKRISTVIKFTEAGEKPDLDQIEEMIRLEEEMPTQQSVKEMIQAKKRWRINEHQLEYEVNEKMKCLTPTISHVKESLEVRAFLGGKLPDPEILFSLNQIDAWICLKGLNMNIDAEVMVNDYIPVIELYLNQMGKEGTLCYLSSERLKEASAFYRLKSGKGLINETIGEEVVRWVFLKDKFDKKLPELTVENIEDIQKYTDAASEVSYTKMTWEEFNRRVRGNP